MQVEISDIEAAAKTLAPTILKTELSLSRSCSTLVGTDVYLKFENLQLTGSFKIRGALNKLLSLTDEEKKRGVVTVSAGNHAQGVAYSAKIAGTQATIVMPTSTPIVKIQATESYGAKVILKGDVYDDSKKEALKLVDEKGYIFVSPFEDEKVIAGQGTIGLEIMDQLPDVDSVIVAIGGGGLISGISKAIKSKKPDCKVYGVVSKAFPGMANMSKGESQPESFPSGTLADGIAVKYPSEEMYSNFIQQQVDEVASIGDDEVAQAIVFLMERTKTVVEGSGAISLAAAAKAKSLGWDLGKKCCVVLCGGNIDLNLVSKIIDKGMTVSGRWAKLEIVAPDRPGQLMQITNIIAAEGANILQIHHDRLGPDVSIGETSIHIELEARGIEHVRRIRTQLEQAGFSCF